MNSTPMPDCDREDTPLRGLLLDLAIGIACWAVILLAFF